MDPALTYDDPDIRRCIGIPRIEDSIVDTCSQKRIISDKYKGRKYHKLASPRARA